ncbi:hypothetical protein ABZZ20_03880 [Streptomyces sp. NPDC006430]|uniref:hypothetical protein n=1 Tax=Streptomyces sp. NPDC006430 TaxID=3154299 RepID=UPI0033A6EEFB
MHIRVRPQAAAVIALAASAALALVGCTAAGDTGAGQVNASSAAGGKNAPAAPSAKPTAKTASAPIGRDVVDEEVKAALRSAGLDPVKGKTTAEANGKKNASLVDWTAIVTTQQAEWALPRIGAQLEHLGWRPDPVAAGTLSYDKTDWVLLVGTVKQAEGVTLRSTESLLTVNVTYLGAG